MTKAAASSTGFWRDIRPFFHRRHLTYVDVGAFEGRVLEEVLESGLKIGDAHLIEPNEKSLKVAEAKAATVFADRARSVDFYHVALGASVGRARLHAAKSMTKVLKPTADRLSKQKSGADVAAQGEFEIARTTLDELSSRFGGQRISLLKVDVEGSELDVLAGATELLSSQRIDVIYIEAGFDRESTQQCYYRDIEDHLARHGYRLFRIYEQKNEWPVDSPLLRRVNLAFMSPKFAEANPYQLTLDLYEAEGQVRKLQKEVELSTKRAEVSEDERQKLASTLAAADVERTRLGSELAEIRGRFARVSAEHSATEASLADRAAELAEMRRQVQRLEAAVIHEQTLTREARIAAESLEADKQRLGAAVDELRAELAAVSARHGELQAELILRTSKEEAAAQQQTQLLEQSKRAAAALRQSERRRHDLEILNREVLAAVGQIHRRELRAWKEHETALAAVEATLHGPQYRLGAVAMEHLEGAAGLLKLPWALRREYKRRASDVGAASAPATRQAPVSFHGGDQVALPLTLRPQSVLLVPANEARELWVTALTDAAGSTISVEVSELASDAPAERSPVKDRATAWKLRGGRATRVFTIDPGDAERTISVRRAAGDFCILKLELRPREQDERPVVGDEAGRDGEQPSTSRRGRRRRRESSAQATALFPSGTAYPIASALEQKLWGGFAEYAIPELDRLKTSATTGVEERIAAAWYLARWWYTSEAFDKALQNLELASSLHGAPRQRLVLAQAQCLLKLGRSDEAVKLLDRPVDTNKTPDYALLLSTALRASAIANGRSLEQAEAAQLAKINEIFVNAGLAPIAKKVAGRPLALDNIVAHARPAATEQSLTVSVVVPAYNAAESIAWVLESLQTQTWRNLEIVVVDDCSTDDTYAIAQRVAESDSRVRVIRMPQNSGAYPARNAGARNATGDLIMVHDSDDWSHPQQIELQIQALLENPNCAGVKSHWVRVGDNLEVVGGWVPRGTLYDLNFSSLLFRRELLARIGYWDEVRISGDAEFYSRFRAVLGADSVVKLPKKYLLSLSLTRENSLTQSKETHLRSLFYGLRWHYRDSYLSWHAALEPNAHLPFNANERRFPLPVSNRSSRVAPREYDTVVITDFAKEGEALDIAIAEVRRARASGARVGVFHWRHYALTIREPLNARFYEACLTDGIDILTPGNAVNAGCVVVVGPSFLMHKIDPRPRVSSPKVVVLERPALADTTLYYDAAVARRNLREVFGVDGEWVQEPAAAKRSTWPVAVGQTIEARSA